MIKQWMEWGILFFRQARQARVILTDGFNRSSAICDQRQLTDVLLGVLYFSAKHLSFLASTFRKVLGLICFLPNTPFPTRSVFEKPLLPSRRSMEKYYWPWQWKNHHFSTETSGLWTIGGMPWARPNPGSVVTTSELRKKHAALLLLEGLDEHLGRKKGWRIALAGHPTSNSIALG